MKTISARWRITRITGVWCELVGGLILWMVVVVLVRNAGGYPPADIPTVQMLVVGGGLLLLGMGLSRLAGKSSQSQRNHA